MFKVKNIKTGQVRTVYAMHGNHFVFFENGYWVYEDMRLYVPVEKET